MRLTEYAWSGGWDLEKVLTGADVAARCQGLTVSAFARADEAMLWFKASKADQAKFGCARNHYRTHEVLCVVEALEVLQRHFPERFGSGTEAHRPLCRWADGSPVRREQLQDALERSAIACGFPPERFRSHSLRIGGATALYHVRPDVALIQRFGRWTSGAFQAYLWEANEMAKGVGAAMATDQMTVHAAPGERRSTRGSKGARGAKGGKREEDGRGSAASRSNRSAPLAPMAH